jgi:hypothetical protein
LIRVDYENVEESKPEIEVLAHIHLLECIEKPEIQMNHETQEDSIKLPLFLGGFLDFLIETDWNNVRVLDVIEVVAADQCDHGTFGDYNHVPPCREANEA